jgi:hypothetical protein
MEAKHALEGRSERDIEAAPKASAKRTVAKSNISKLTFGSSGNLVGVFG